MGVSSSGQVAVVPRPATSGTNRDDAKTTWPTVESSRTLIAVMPTEPRLVAGNGLGNGAMKRGPGMVTVGLPGSFVLPKSGVMSKSEKPPLNGRAVLPVRWPMNRRPLASSIARAYGSSGNGTFVCSAPIIGAASIDAASMIRWSALHSAKSSVGSGAPGGVVQLNVGGDAAGSPGSGATSIQVSDVSPRTPISRRSVVCEKSAVAQTEQ